MSQIFVVEDDPVTRRTLTESLAELEAEVRDFGSAEEALAACADGSPPVLLVTDIGLPGLGGLELCRELRQRHGRLDLPVIVVSGMDELDEITAGYEAGADEYLTKPVDPAELRAKARVFLTRRAKRQQGRWQRYELFEQLGQGRIATIYRAERKGDKKELALKVVAADASRDTVDRLLREAELLRGLEDVPGIVRIRDLGSDGGCTYYAMDLIRGGTLAERIEAQAPLPVAECAAIVHALARSLAALAERQVVHGDIKPGNVLIAEPGSTEVILADFGMATVERGAGWAGENENFQPAAGARPEGDADPGRGGTLNYLAPEVLRGEAGTCVSDLYSLGVVLFEVLTGRLPYPQTGAELAALKVEGAEPELDALIDQGVPPGIVAVVEGALEPDPERRISRASDLATALMPYAGKR